MKINPTRNLSLKILALIIAFLLWIYFTGETTILKDIEVPLNIIVAPDKVGTGDIPSTVTVRVRGPETAIARLTDRSIYSNIDLLGVPPGEKFVQLSPGTNIRGVPAELEVVSVTPDRINIVIDSKATRWIPVVPKISGSAREPYQYYGYDVYPSSIMIEGAQSIVNKTERSVTEVIDIDGKKESFRTVVDVIPEHQDVRIVNPKPVTVSIKIDKDIKRAFFEALPISFSSDDHDIVPSHDIISLTIEGPESVIRKIDRSSIGVNINLKGLKPSNTLYQLAPLLSFNSLSEGETNRISIRSMQPETISIKINPGRHER